MIKFKRQPICELFMLLGHPQQTVSKTHHIWVAQKAGISFPFGFLLSHKFIAIQNIVDDP